MCIFLFSMYLSSLHVHRCKPSFPSNMSTSSRPSSSSSSTSGPLLGSAYLTSQSLIPPASPNDLSQSVCLNISLFKSTIKKYRALDDAITTRLNRDAALHRGDPSTSTGKDGLPVLDVNEAAQGQTCLRIWQDMIGEPSKNTLVTS